MACNYLSMPQYRMKYDSLRGTEAVSSFQKLSYHMISSKTEAARSSVKNVVLIWNMTCHLTAAHSEMPFFLFAHTIIFFPLQGIERSCDKSLMSYRVLKQVSGVPYGNALLLVLLIARQLSHHNQRTVSNKGHPKTLLHHCREKYIMTAI